MPQPGHSILDAPKGKVERWGDQQVKVAHIRLCHSRMFLVRAYPRETQEMVFDAHERPFRLFVGACRRGTI
jgi:transposase